ncbi:hypothetical protein Hdeb2414_s0006g00191191 [Helianthus debilis subsp. tardiflorus]
MDVGDGADVGGAAATEQKREKEMRERERRSADRRSASLTGGRCHFPTDFVLVRKLHGKTLPPSSF